MSKINIEEEFLLNFNSLHTRRSYKTDLLQFIKFIENSFSCIESFDQLQRKHIIDYRNFLAEFGGLRGEPMAPKTIARKLAALSSYFDFLIESYRVIEFNPTTSVKRPRLEVLYPTHALSVEQVVELFLEIDKNQNSGIMHKALLVTLFTSGLRKSEILNLRRLDYIQINEVYVLKFKGKGGKVREKAVHPEASKVLDIYFDWMKSIGREHGPYDWIFQPTMNNSDKTNLSKQLNPMTINKIIKKYSKLININFNVSPHTARATFISALLDQGIPIADVAKEVSHASITTTQEYDKRRNNLKNSPVFKLKYGA